MKRKVESGTVRILRDLDQIERDIVEYGHSEVARNLGIDPRAFWNYMAAARKFAAEGRVPRIGRPAKAREVAYGRDVMVDMLNAAPIITRPMSPVASVNPSDWEAEEYGSLPTYTPYRHEGREFEDEPNM